MFRAMKNIFCLLAFIVTPTTLIANSLTEDLDRFVKQYLESAPDNVRNDFSRSINDIEGSGILDRALNVGDIAPEFNLPNAVGKEVSLYDKLYSGPVVLVWYRGGWCPYCNLQLQHFQKQLAEIKNAGGQVIAISPELPDKAMSTKEKQGLEFEVLSDVDNKVADRYKLAYTVPDYVVDHYDFSVTLNEHNGNDSKRLPLAVTYIIDRSGTITYAFLDADYKNRASPEDIIYELKKINKL